MKELSVGCAQVDITPSEPVLLSGYANRQGFSTGVHRSLSSRCIVFKARSETVCLITYDLVDILPELTQEIIHRISQQTGLPADHIFAHAIHTHSAPIMEYGASAQNDRYIAWAMDRIAANGVKTLADTASFQVCSVHSGTGRCGISANRRLIDPQTGIAAKTANVDGPNDQEVNVLQLLNGQGKPVATLFTFACHAVVLGYESLAVSTDYPGAARETIEQAAGGMAIFLNGAAGNINPSVTDQTNPAVADQEGKKLGMAVLESTMEAWTDEVDISIGRRSVQLPYRDQRMTAERFDGEVERRLHEQTEFHHWPDDLRRWCTQMKRRLASGTLPDACTVEIGAFRMGPALFLLSQGEVFNEYQLRAKQHFPGKRVFFIAYTNGMRGYIPTADAFRHKGYEVDQAYVYMEEPSPLTPEADAIYQSAVNDLLRQISS